MRRLLPLLLASTLAAGAATAGWNVLWVLRAAEPASSVHFDQGLTAIDPKAPMGWTNRWCGSCHAEEYARWNESRHAHAGINKNFQAQSLGRENRITQFCLNCHAPINPGLAQWSTTEISAPVKLFQSPPDWLTAGVDCLSCHVRDGKVQVAHVTPEAQKAHPARLAPELGTAEFCAGCHQFRFKSLDLPDGFRGQHQQASLLEFLDFRTVGGRANRCHDCHMPDNDHLMPGGYSPKMLERALGMELEAQWLEDQGLARVSVSISARRVGHRVPGGEFHRYLTLHTTLLDADGQTVIPQPAAAQPTTDTANTKPVDRWPQIETIRRPMGAFERGVNPSAEPFDDTRLWPGETRRFTYVAAIDPRQTTAPWTARVELWYHVLEEAAAGEIGLARDEVTRLVRRVERALE